MSSGLVDRTARGLRAENPGNHVAWFSPANGATESTAWELAGFSHDQVELPSRRWYIEAVREAQS